MSCRNKKCIFRYHLVTFYIQRVAVSKKVRTRTS